MGATRPVRRPPGRPRDRSKEPLPDVPPRGSAPSARDRFLATDPYRAEREWKRYEGTPQRDLFRELRLRFLRRHAVASRWVLDVGAGPGRFTPAVGASDARRVALDLSREMLSRVPRTVPGAAGGPPVALDRVVGDALAPPFPRGSFGEVAVVGNAVGFAGEGSERMLGAVEALVAPGGTLIVEIAPGAGERSRYLGRLPPGTVGRLLAAPPAAVVPRIQREGFTAEPRRHREEEFQRVSVPSLHARWAPPLWELLETVAVAPSLGSDADRIARVRPDAKAWDHLLAVEEEVGRQPARWRSAAAVLVAARRSVTRQD
ncbi:MAG: class I SAM-dependent methyltransferase [Thermoplasmata archaeon]